MMDAEMQYLRGDLLSFRLFDFLDEELPDDERELRSVFEVEFFCDKDFDFELLLLLLPDFGAGFDADLMGEREFLCLSLLFSRSIELLLLLLT